MDIKELTKELLSKLESEKTIHVRVLTRDENGSVVKEKIAPIHWVSGVFSDKIFINIEESEMSDRDPNIYD